MRRKPVNVASRAAAIERGDFGGAGGGTPRMAVGSEIPAGPTLERDFAGYSGGARPAFSSGTPSPLFVSRTACVLLPGSGREMSVC